MVETMETWRSRALSHYLSDDHMQLYNWMVQRIPVLNVDDVAKYTFLSVSNFFNLSFDSLFS